MASTDNSRPLIRPSVKAAHALIAPYIHHTPVLTNSYIDGLASTPQKASALVGTPWEGKEPAKPTVRLWFKCENLQKVGAFKARGAFHALLRLKEEEGGWEEGGERRTKGVVTHSSGNHAQALAYASRVLGIPAHIVMPTISTPSKIAATRGYGANIIHSGSTSVEREAVVEQVIADTGAKLVPPYDHPDIMLGQGTMGLEFQEQVEEKLVSSGAANRHLNAIMTPCGGGGMLSGVAISCHGTKTLVFGSEPSFEGADDCHRGLACSPPKRVEKVSTLTVADGLRTPVGPWPWKIISDKAFVKGVYTVTEEQIIAAMRLVLERMKVVVEPSGCVPLAVVLFNEDFRALIEREGGAEGWDLGLVFSGGNVSVEALGKMFEVAPVQAERQEGKVGADGKKVAENIAG